MAGWDVIADIQVQTTLHWPKTAKMCDHGLCYSPTFSGVTKTLHWHDIHLISKHPKQYGYLDDGNTFNEPIIWMDRSF